MTNLTKSITCSVLAKGQSIYRRELFLGPCALSRVGMVVRAARAWPRTVWEGVEKTAAPGVGSAAHPTGTQ